MEKLSHDHRSAKLAIRDAMASPDAHVYEPRSGHRLRHDPFNAIVGPRPIGWISTIGADGVANLAPYSYFNAFNYFPPVIGFATIGAKDTLRNVEATGEFCWSLATRALAPAMNLTCAPAPPEIDEFEVAGLTKIHGRLVKAPMVLESPVNFECRSTQLIRLTLADRTEVDTWLIMGEVVAVHIDHAFIPDGLYETAAARPILRAGRLGDYSEITPDSMFTMDRANWPIGGAR
jgi:flavin reductase (DIM6/NTAB) family NADH-FMN oxidoreductase RutF